MAAEDSFPVRRSGYSDGFAAITVTKVREIKRVVVSGRRRSDYFCKGNRLPSWFAGMLGDILSPF
jgi:hypothetical protein